ncbi:hypothetical protein [Streptomyces longwoodensis]|uniref:hypothetical protein n=1 Tax=Streptomyces longwoodensis TaxID=68231 RepID=UPI0036FF337A
MALLSQRAALTGALAILRDLADPTPCEPAEHGGCAAHDWRPGPDACPQLRLRILLQELDKHPAIPPYGQLSLIALLRGCTHKQQVHVRVQVNGYAHRGVLGWDPDTTPAAAARPFHVDLLHGERVEQISADDVLEADVCPRHLNGVPLDPTHDPA